MKEAIKYLLKLFDDQENELNKLDSKTKSRIKKNRIKMIKNNFGEAIKFDDFFKLPNNEIFKIYSNVKNINFHQTLNFVQKMSEKMGDDSPLILKYIKIEGNNYNEYLKVLENIKNCDFLENFTELTNVPVYDYETEIKILEKEVKDLKKEIEMINKYPPILTEPQNYERDFFKAVDEDNFLSLRYSIENMKLNPERIIFEEFHTPLICYAAEKGKVKVVKYLVEKCKVDPDSKNSKGMTPLLCMKDGTDSGKVTYQYLLGVCNQNIKDNEGRTALHHAVLSDMDDIVDFLYNRDINEVDKNGKAALHYAAEKGNLIIFKKLIKKGADYNIEDNEKKNPIVYAIENNRLNIIQFLFENFGLDRKEYIKYADEEENQSIFSFLSE